MLHDIRESKVWQEAQEEANGQRDREWVRRFLAKGKSVKEIADLMDFSVKEVRRLAKHTAK